jgi:hypothetical protein
MATYEGQEWPSLTRDFGVVHQTDPYTGRIVKENEFKLDYDGEIADAFPTMDKLDNLFEKLGQDIALLQRSFAHMFMAEEYLFNEAINPPPRDKLGRKKDDFMFQNSRLAERNYLRFHFEYNFNKLADETRTYLRIRFDDKKKYHNAGPFDQYLTFIFPQSDAERQVWQHVFWGVPEPVDGYNNTPESRWLADYDRNQQRQTGSLGDLTSRMNGLQMGNGSTPPAYESSAFAAKPRTSNY